LAYDPFPTPDWAKQHGVQYVALPALLQGSDVVSLHLPLLPEPFHLLGAETLAQMKPGTILINTSRGKLIDFRLDCVVEGPPPGGVALDVYEEEEGIFLL
jgi:D-lactate dehydrogenase